MMRSGGIMRFFKRGLLFCTLSIIILASCGFENNKKSTEAVAKILPATGSNVNGTIVFKQEESGVRVKGVIKNLAPGKHALHVHRYGDLSTFDASSACDHFNPTNKKHGGRADAERHIGDLGNIEADKQGVAQFDFVDTQISLSGPHSIVGRSMMVHAKEDDLISQPSGNAGGRIGVGVVGIKNPNINPFLKS